MSAQRKKKKKKTRAKSGRSPFLLKRFWLLLFLPAAVALDFAAKRSPDFAEWYAVHIYPLYAKPLSALFALAPVSVGEILLIAGSLALLAFLVYGTVRLCADRQRRRERLVRLLSVPAVLASLIAFLCVSNYGTNHRRWPFAQTAGLEVRESSAEELYALCAELTEEANRLREGQPEDADGVFLLNAEPFEAAETAKRCFNRLTPQYPTLETWGKPKPIFFSEVFSYLDISGIFCPFTFEANVNVHAEDALIPATMCHELSHLSGYMREDEANFIAYLACRAGNDAAFQYSGTLFAMIHATNALYDADRTLWEKADALRSEGVRRDLAANNAYWERYDTPVAEVSDRVNDAYLKANGQEHGVRSYGRMVDLLLAERRARLGDSRTETKPPAEPEPAEPPTSDGEGAQDDYNAPDDGEMYI